MGHLYCGFDVQSMLNYLKEYCTEVQLTAVGNEWKIRIVSDSGEFETTSALFHAVYLAFKPFANRAKESRERNRKTLKDLLDLSSGITKRPEEILTKYQRRLTK